MKSLLATVLCLISTQVFCVDASIEKAKSWLNDWMPEHVSVDVNSSRMTFHGGKQKEMFVAFNQTLSDKFSLESQVKIVKATLSWGIVKQRLAYRELVLVPRYALTEDLSLGFGVVKQMSAEFKSAIGSLYDLPSNTEWLVSARTSGFDSKDSLELSISSQKWQATQALGNWFETGEANNKVDLTYTGYF